MRCEEKDCLSFFLPAKISVRISQINDEFKFSRESPSFLMTVVVAATPLLVSHLKKVKKRKTVNFHKTVHCTHDCSPLQQIAMAEKIGNWSLKG
jgi:hypothetical protein